jgi:hypothetical protein
LAWPKAVPPEPQKGHELHVARITSTLAQHQRREQQLRAQEAELSGLIAAEQGRWQEFNARLDDLERSLPTTTPR